MEKPHGSIFPFSSVRSFSSFVAALGEPDTPIPAPFWWLFLMCVMQMRSALCGVLLAIAACDIKAFPQLVVRSTESNASPTL